MNALPLGSRFLAHIVGTVALIWRSMLRAAGIAGGIGFVVVEIGDCVAAYHFPPSVPAQFVALAFAFGLAYAAAVTVLLLEVIAAVAGTIRRLEGDAAAGVSAAETLAALEAGRLFTRSAHAHTTPPAQSALARSTGTLGRVAAGLRGGTIPPSSVRGGAPLSTNQQRTNGTNPLPGAGRATTGRPRTIGEAAERTRPSLPGTSSAQWQRDASATNGAASPVEIPAVKPFAQGDMVPQLPPLPVRADRLPRITWANAEDAHDGSQVQPGSDAASAATDATLEDVAPHEAPLAAAVDAAMADAPQSAERVEVAHHSAYAQAFVSDAAQALGAAALSEAVHHLMGSHAATASPSAPSEDAPHETPADAVAETANARVTQSPRPLSGPASQPSSGILAVPTGESEPLYTDPPLATPRWGPQFEESAISSDAPTIVVPTLNHPSGDEQTEDPTVPSGMGEPAERTLPRQAMPTRPLSRSGPRPSGPFDVPTQGGGLWERLGLALRGQVEQVPAASSHGSDVPPPVAPGEQ